MLFRLFKKKNSTQVDQTEESLKPFDNKSPEPEGKKVFEDSFMEVQEKLITLCLELAGDTAVDEIFVYGSIEDGAYSFNAFYVKQGQALATHKIKEDLPTIKQFLTLGCQDLFRLEKVCKEYGRPVPTELRLHYTLVGGHLDAHYEYKSICGPGSGLSPTKVFHDWRATVEKELSER